MAERWLYVMPCAMIEVHEFQVITVGTSMITKSYTLQLDGTVTLDRFASAIDAWRTALVDISKEVGQEHILGIYIEDLTSGSALVISSIMFDAEVPAQQFTSDFTKVGTRARGEKVVDFPKSLQKAANLLRSVAAADPSGITIASDTADVLIFPTIDRKTESLVSRELIPSSPSVETYGAMRGRLQSVSSRSGLKAVLYDDLFDKAVRCSLTKEQHETVRELWDKHVVVEGLIRRDRITGRPLSMSNIWNIREDERDPTSLAWLKAFGVLAGVEPDVPVEESIRKVRNG